VASNHWGSAVAVVIEAEQREGGVLAGWPRAPPLLFNAKQIGQGGGSRSRSPAGLCKDLLLKPLGQFEKK
jgi:hypothetical protein